MELTSGPDGGVFVLDWSDAGECHEHTGVHRTSGRVYKIVFAENKKKQKKHELDDLRLWSSQALAEAHKASNDWFVRQARLELARRYAADEDISRAIQSLRSMFDASETDQVCSVRTLLTLHVIGGMDYNDLQLQLRHNDEHVRAWAIRLLTEGWTIDDAIGPTWNTEHVSGERIKQTELLLPSLVAMANEDSSALVRLTLASTLQRIPTDSRATLAAALVSRGEDADDHNLPLMVWYGLIPVAEADCGALVTAAKSCQLPLTLRLIARCLAEEIEDHPEALNDLLAVADKRDDNRFRESVLVGISEGLRGWQRTPKPSMWDQISSWNSAGTDSLILELSVVFGDGRALDELKDIATGKLAAEPATRLAALETLIQNKPDDLRSICESLLTDGHMNVLAVRRSVEL